MSSFVDSHCHLDVQEFVQDRDGILRRARAKGVRWFVTIGAGRGTESAPDAVALAHTYDDVAACVGIHPNDASTATEQVLGRVASLALDPRVVGVGETGLDYRPGGPPRETQLEAFRRSVDIARGAGKPIVIHSRDAGDDVLSVLRDERASEVGGVIHSCGEGEAFVRAVLDLGFSIAFSPHQLGRRAARTRDVARLVPRDRLLIETSAPCHDGSVTHASSGCAEPDCLPEVAAQLAELLEVSVQDLARWTTENAVRRFNLDRMPAVSRRSLPVSVA